MNWEDQLWEEIDSVPKADQIVLAGDVITRMTRILLPALGNRRRARVVELIEGGLSSVQLAESIGARPSTVSRLLEEGRKIRRMERREEELAA